MVWVDSQVQNPLISESREWNEKFDFEKVACWWFLKSFLNFYLIKESAQLKNNEIKTSFSPLLSELLSAEFK